MLELQRLGATLVAKTAHSPNDGESALTGVTRLLEVLPIDSRSPQLHATMLPVLSIA